MSNNGIVENFEDSLCLERLDRKKRIARLNGRYILISKFKLDCTLTYHSTLSKNLMKLRDPETGPSQGGRAWSRGPKSELFEILQNRDPYR